MRHIRSGDVVKILVRELSAGENPFDFEVPVAELNSFVSDADDLYYARNAGGHVMMIVDKVDEILSVRGRIQGASCGFECARCLKENARPLDIRLRWTLVPRSTIARAASLSPEEEVELTTDDLDVSFFDGDEIDLMEIVREAILLELDPAPRCEVDSCEFQGYAAPPSPEAEPEIDPRWAPLQAMKEKLKNKN
jgi:uncharacterized metal-binding protein YceD (DUF177 family)